MNLSKRQIQQSTYTNGVGRVFRKGSFWDKMFKAATGIATVLLAPLGAAMALADKVTPERDAAPGGGGTRGSRGNDFNYDAGNVAGIGKTTPKVF